MKKKYRIIALFSAALISAALMSACNENQNTAGNNNSNSAETSVIQIEQSKSGNDNPSDNGEEDVPSPESSVEENSIGEISEQPEEQSENNIEESSGGVSEQENSTENSSNENSNTYEGYYFDDEQIVDDYHTATEFTDNEEFNALFTENPINSEYNSELQNVSTVAEMRNVTIQYAEKWKNEVSSVYDELYALLEKNDEAKNALEKSQTEWLGGLADVENEFYEKVSSDGAGSESLLSADTAVMNYYRGRAAVLYEQIYELTGKFEM